MENGVFSNPLQLSPWQEAKMQALNFDGFWDFTHVLLDENQNRAKERGNWLSASRTANSAANV